MFRSVVIKGFICGVTIGMEVFVSLLQYADDCIVLGEANFENLWTIKTIFRSYELIWGLKMNLFKSNIYGVNV